MREILFKAKRKDNGEWVEGYLFDNGMPKRKRYFVGGLVIEPYTGTACDEWDITAIDFYEIYPETICQYTGLVDKNGQKIFENDVVKKGDLFGKITYVECHFQINWYFKNTYGKFVRYSTQQLFEARKFSIFDNKELMEVLE